MKRNEISIKDVVRLYKDNGRNASIVGSMIGLSRERIRQILEMAEQQGLMTNRRTPFDSERWFPTILKIIKSGGDIFDIVEETNLSPQRIAWCLLEMRKRRLITKKQHKLIAMASERNRIKRYLRKDNLTGRIINDLYNDNRPVRANDLYYWLLRDVPFTPVTHEPRYKHFYCVIARLASKNVLYRPEPGVYQLHEDFIPVFKKYLNMQRKGDLRVSKHM